MSKLQKQRILRWGLVIANMLAIFLFSGQTGEDSGELSGLLAAILSKAVWLGWVFQYINIRKAAHFSIYFLLGIFTIRAVALHTEQTKARIGAALVICFLYACSDELHQHFVPGRGPSFRDVLIDTAGALTSIGILTVVSWRRLKSSDKQVAAGQTFG